MRLIVGSTALAFAGVPIRVAKDLDVICDVFEGRDDEILIPSEILQKFRHVGGYVVPDHLLTLKLSHMGWQTHKEQYKVWQKHKQDVVYLLNLGYTIDVELYHTLVAFWKQEKGNKEFLSFDKTSEEFFDDHVVYVYDHDYLHDCIKYPPTYISCLEDGEEVEICEEKFNTLPFSDKISFFKEEITVIAIERWVVHSTTTWYRAYQLSLEKTITRLTKDWMTDFILLNLGHFLQPDVELFYNFFNTHEEYIMTDTTVFEELYEKYGQGCGICSFVGLMFEGDFDYFDFDKLLGKSYSDFEDYKGWSEAKDDALEELGIEHLDQEGGGEGGSEYCCGVLRIGNTIYKAEWSYYSHHGMDYDYIMSAIKEVTPKTKTITVYE